MFSNKEDDGFSISERILFHIYLFIFCLFVLILGIFGNVSVIYIYTRRLNVLIFGFFIKVLAVFDILTTCVSIPCILAFRLTPQILDLGIMCQLMTFVKHFSGMNSGIIFIIIAVQRFRKICRPTKKQITEQLAKKLVLFSICLSVVVSIPIRFFVVEKRIVVERRKHNVTVAICDFTEDFKGYTVSIVYAVWISLKLVAITTTLTVLYGFNARELKTIIVNRSETFRPSTNGRSGRKLTSTIIFFVLTVVFLITSFPMVVVGMYSSLVTMGSEWSYVGITFYDLAVDLIFINCVVNPIVYSFNSAAFRRECKKSVRALTCQRGLTNEQQNSQQNTSTNFMSTLS